MGILWKNTQKDYDYIYARVVFERTFWQTASLIISLEKLEALRLDFFAGLDFSGKLQNNLE